MDGTGEHHSKQSQPGSEDQKLYVLPHMWSLDLELHAYNPSYSGSRDQEDQV
jgi:hypothetical protein